VDLAAVYSRVIDDQSLTLSASGWVYIRTFLLYDYETESLLFPFSGEDGLTCIGGKFADRELEPLQFERMPWSEWLKNNPETGFLVY
jgi:hypothetical protein